jgi:hypothetical protein
MIRRSVTKVCMIGLLLRSSGDGLLAKMAFLGRVMITILEIGLRNRLDILLLR